MTITTEAPTTVATQIEVKARAFGTALAAVIPLASTDKTIPMLNAVRLVGADGKLTLVTTDRYVLGTYVIEYEGPAFEFSLALDVAKKLAATWKKSSAYEPVFIDIDEDKVTFRTFDGSTMVRIGDDDFPKWRSLIPDAEPGLPNGTIAFDPAKIALFKGIGARMEPMRLRMTGVNRPIRIDIGDYFVGLIMPMRIATT